MNNSNITTIIYPREWSAILQHNKIQHQKVNTTQLWQNVVYTSTEKVLKIDTS